MTLSNTVLDAASPGMAINRSPSTPVVDGDALQGWQTELNDFVTNTRRRLENVSQSLVSSLPSVECQSLHRDEEDTNATGITVAANSAESQCVSDAPLTREASQAEVDPMDRLRAIKLRLAKQLSK